MAKPDKTDLLNAFLARSMEAWARATADLDRQRKRTGSENVSLSVDDAIFDGPPATPVELLNSS